MFHAETAPAGVRGKARVRTDIGYGDDGDVLEGVDLYKFVQQRLGLFATPPLAGHYTLAPEQMKLMSDSLAWLPAKVERLNQARSAPSKDQKLDWLIKHFPTVAPTSYEIIKVQHNGGTYEFSVGVFRHNAIHNFLDTKSQGITKLDGEQKARWMEGCAWLEAAIKTRKQRFEAGAEAAAPAVSEPA